MRGLHLSAASLSAASLSTVVLALVPALIASSATQAGTVCSVFDKHPCAPTVCSPFRRRPCRPEFEPPIGQDLRLTIDAALAKKTGAQDGGQDRDWYWEDDDSERQLNTLRQMFAALRARWEPPPLSDARHGMQMSVRLSFKRNGEIIGTPRVTYTTPNVPPETKDVYHQAITAALERCTPMRFTGGLGGAIAGRPLSIRFVDNREQP
jgi:hypothetical protein